MNLKSVEDIAKAVLYEGYLLYPYRPSAVKNRQRWNFGVVYPKPYAEIQNGADSWFMKTECLAIGSSSTELTIKVRFLQAVARTIGEFDSPFDEWPPRGDGDQVPGYQMVETLRVGDQFLHAWQEAIEREIVIPSIRLEEGPITERTSVIDFPEGKEFEPVSGSDGSIVALIVRAKEHIDGKVTVAAKRIADGLFKITVRIENITAAPSPVYEERNEAIMHSLLSAHTILNVDGGEFVSHLDPPAALKDFVNGCNNVGTWPVLAGEEDRRDTVLSSPIILYDYPQIAPESAGDLFDGTEIDEILALRILTLTEEEKREMRDTDEHTRLILERTETMPAEHFMKLHGVLRGLSPVGGEKQ